MAVGSVPGDPAKTSLTGLGLEELVVDSPVLEMHQQVR
jgi:hypothetical protein